jgi:hypothetical protein
MVRQRLSAIVIAATLAASAARGADASLAPYAAVDVEPVKTWVYLASVTLSVGRFVRHGDSFTATYAAKVFPYFFYNEQGSLRIDVPDDALRQLAAGHPFDFKGNAVREDGKVRRVDGTVTPIDAGTGRIRVRLFYSRRIVLVFRTTYGLPAVGSAPGAQNSGQSQ